VAFSAFRKLARRLIPRSLVRYRGPAAGNKVALTFDDGPHAELTPRVLRILKERGMAATFFVIGRRAESCPALLGAMHAQGCEVGNHSWSHLSFRGLPFRDMVGEIERTDAVIRAAVGRPPAHFRPPQGVLSVRLLWHLRRRRMLPAVLWSIHSSREYVKTSVEILADLRQSSPSPGDIVLLHDANRGTVEALPAILDLFEERGLRAVTLAELCAGPTRAPTLDIPEGVQPCSAS
jgi:peptidoglycan/xylan/chitin deacetylase (PgdA/CDA1 family)